MTRYKGIGKTGLVLAVMAMIAMTAVSFVFRPEMRISGELGICMPSPNLWDINPVSSWIINTVLLGAIAAGGFFLNRTHNFIRSTQPVLPAMFLVLAGSNPWLNYYLSSSTLICAVNLMALSVLFGEYNSRNATQPMFVIGTFISIGSMFQYAMLPMTVAYILGAIIMKSFRIKEFLALMMGLLAPYWVGVGLGLISPDAFEVPDITNLFSDFAKASEIFVMALSVGIAIFFGGLLAMNNSIKLYAGNSRVNALNMTVTLLGLVCSVCIIVDFSNMLAYLGTLYFYVAVQVANLCALWKMRKEWLAVLIPGVIYIGFFLAMILGGGKIGVN